MRFDGTGENPFAMARQTDDPAAVVGVIEQIESASAVTLLEQLASAITNDRPNDALALLRQLRREYDAQSPTTEQTITQVQSVRTAADSDFATVEEFTNYLSQAAQIRTTRAVVVLQVATYIQTSGQEVSKREVLETIEQAKQQEKAFSDEAETVQGQLDALTIPAQVTLLDVDVSQTQLGVGEDSTVVIEVANVGDDPAQEVTVAIDGGQALSVSETTRSLGEIAPNERQRAESSIASIVESETTQSQKQTTVEITGAKAGREAMEVSVRSANAGSARDSVTMTVADTEDNDGLGPGDFEIVAITEQTPTEVTVDEPFDVQYTVENVAEEAARQAVTLELAGESVATKPDTLTSGQSLTNSFSDVTLPESVSAGDTVELTVRTNNDAETIQLSVNEETTESPVTPYTNDNGVVDNSGVVEAVTDWQAGELYNSEIVQVISSWQTGQPAS
jgi:hypothetical protein